MNKHPVIFTLLFFFLAAALPGQDLLSGKYTGQEIEKLLIPADRWTPFPRLADREAWAGAGQEILRACIKSAEKDINYGWPSIPATKSLLFTRTGNRSEYENMSFKKRAALINMLMAELAENQGRFIDPIINGVWSICEESWWGVPAHLPHTKESAGLMNVSEPFVDLFCATTGGVLAWVDYFLGEKLDAVSPQIRKRIRREINLRMLQPLMTRPHGWMRPDAKGRPPNNWNPWICSNWLTCVLLMEKDNATRAPMVAKILKVLDEYANPYPRDGGCDEGPGYWGAAVGALYDNVALLNLATGGAFDYVFADLKFQNMGRFIYRMQISENYFVNFADAHPRPGVSAGLLYRYGRDIEDPAMRALAARAFKPGAAGYAASSHLARFLFEVFLAGEIRGAPRELVLPRDVWLPDLQVMAAREREGDTRGFYLAAKGGHNAESHNHNDIGNFIVYYDGLPLLIDVGSGKYTARTFPAPGIPSGTTVPIITMLPP
jgi:hypothetical protein